MSDKKAGAVIHCSSCAVKLRVMPDVLEAVCRRCQSRLSTALHIERQRMHALRVQHAVSVASENGVGINSVPAREVDELVLKQAGSN